MKKLILLFLTISLIGCSAEYDEVVETGNLNIPEIFHGNFTGGAMDYKATITRTYVQVETSSGEKIVNTADSEYFNGVNYYRADLANDELLVLTKANGYVGISYIKADGSWYISEFFTEN
jgi:hypothetical protein